MADSRTRPGKVQDEPGTACSAKNTQWMRRAHDKQE